MDILFITHPLFGDHQSMPRFAAMLADGMKSRGHTVSISYPKPYFFHLPVPAALKKWMGYVDQYIIFPQQLRKQLRTRKENSLVVFTDHALGPWVPLVKNKPHVIHCHDFLAQRSALGEIKENPTGFTGRLYQKFIRSGYKKGNYFISVSERTKQDLHRFLSTEPAISEVVYNGLNQSFVPMIKEEARAVVAKALKLSFKEGYILHVGGNQWYKNRVGVIELYTEWRKHSQKRLPLLLIGAPPNKPLQEVYETSPFKEDIHLVTGVPDNVVRQAYAGASLLLFPSLAEGFGWPIAEAMASGCPVITTGENPMQEVAGIAGFFLRRMPAEKIDKEAWLKEGCVLIERITGFSPEKLNAVIEEGIINAQRFNTAKALDQIEAIYNTVLSSLPERPIKNKT